MKKNVYRTVSLGLICTVLQLLLFISAYYIPFPDNDHLKVIQIIIVGIAVLPVMLLNLSPNYILAFVISSAIYSCVAILVLLGIDQFKKKKI